MFRTVYLSDHQRTYPVDNLKIQQDFPCGYSTSKMATTSTIYNYVEMLSLIQSYGIRETITQTAILSVIEFFPVFVTTVCGISMIQAYWETDDRFLPATSLVMLNLLSIHTSINGFYIILFNTSLGLSCLYTTLFKIRYYLKHVLAR